MRRQMTIDFNRVLRGDLVRANARRALPGTAIAVGARLVVGDDDWGVARADVIEFDASTGALVLRILGDLEPETPS
jgi:hypothetical protein